MDQTLKVERSYRHEATHVTPRAPTIAREPSVGVVIPTLNEAANIAWVLGRLPPGLAEVVIVDGRSTDDTVAVARAVRPDVAVVLEPRPGKGAALLRGFDSVSSDYVVMMDGDGSMDPAEIVVYTALLDRGYDVVKGSRYACGGSSSDLTLVRSAGNSSLRALVNLLFRASFSDLCYGFCAFRAPALRALGLTAEGFEIETQIALRALQLHLRVAEVPTIEAARHFGESHLNAARDGVRVLDTVLREWRNAHVGASEHPRVRTHEELTTASTDVPPIRRRRWLSSARVGVGR